MTKRQPRLFCSVYNNNCVWGISREYVESALGLGGPIKKCQLIKYKLYYIIIFL